MGEAVCFYLFRFVFCSLVYDESGFTFLVSVTLRTLDVNNLLS